MAKGKASKLPKRIAGVKVPKFLRDPGTIEQLINSPVGRVVLAEALIAAATALKNYKPVAEAAGHVTEMVEHAGSAAAETAKDLVQNAAGGLADMAAGVVRQIVPAAPTAAEDNATTSGSGRRGRPRKEKDDDRPSNS